MLHASIAPIIGNNRYGDEGHPDVFITIDVDATQMYFLNHFMKEANFNFHLFMKKEDFDSDNLLINYKDWISFMNFTQYEY
ncbi:hypothetical protein [Bacillus sp. 2205SS5-2]|uniref:hypothetical protein n=1 Tax=Bacillus sp. 2205SS5-2 TaxID=3109031 RepID=UPI003006EAEF